MTAAPKDLANSLQTLSLHPSPSKSSSSFKKPQQPPSLKTAPDSWDEELSSGSDTETETEPLSNPLSPQQSSSYPNAPPPTPISPTTNTTFASPFGYPGENAEGREERYRERRGGDGEKRKDTTDAVAKRLIAGALGVKVPKKTEEQRAYERAVKEKEIKRRKEEKEMEERRKKEAEEMKKKVWDDD